MSDLLAFKTGVILSLVSIAIIWALDVFDSHAPRRAAFLRTRLHRGREVGDGDRAGGARILDARTPIDITRPRPVHRGHAVVEVPCRVMEPPTAGRVYRGNPVEVVDGPEESSAGGQKFTAAGPPPVIGVPQHHPW